MLRVEGTVAPPRADRRGPAQVQIVVVHRCPPDFDRDEMLNFFDDLDFIAAHESDSLSADFNNDGRIDFLGYIEFIASCELGR
jgi:hypothetical protein